MPLDNCLDMSDSFYMDRRTASDQTQFFSAREASDFSGVASARTFLRWAKTGKIPHIALPNGQVRFLRTDVEALLTPVVGQAVSADELEAGQ